MRAKRAAREIDVAELAERLRARGRARRSPSSHSSSRARIDVKRDLGIDVGGDVRAPEAKIRDAIFECRRRP